MVHLGEVDLSNPSESCGTPRMPEEKDPFQNERGPSELVFWGGGVSGAS